MIDIDGSIVSLVREISSKTTFPIVLTATNPWNNKFSVLRSRSNLVKFEHLSPDSVFAILKNICKKEKLKVKDDKRC